MSLLDTNYNPAISSAGGKYELSKLDTTGATSGQVVKYNGTTVVWGNEAVAPSEIALTNANILVGNASNVAAGVAMSGDATIANTGAITIANSAVTLAKLATGVAPAYVSKFGGKITWSGSGATLATTVTGVAATDIVIATIQTKPTEAAYLVAATPSTNTVTLELSAANTSNDAVIAYQVFRVAA